MRLIGSGCAWMLSALLVAGAGAQELPKEGPVETKATISVEVKDGVKLDAAQMKLEVNGQATPLISLAHVQPSAVQVAILIDDGLRSSFDLQIRDLKKFVTELPDGVQVSVGYMRNGTVMGEKEFTNDHVGVAAAIRVPVASAGISASPYFCLSDFVKHWPSQEPATRVVLMLTNGVDPYNGNVSVTNQDSPYVQTAQEDAQRAGVVVYAIAYGNAGMGGGAAAFSGQSYLDQVAHATGGRSLYQGTFNPVSITPFLNAFKSDLAESYTARFLVSANHEKASTLTRIKLTTSQAKVKIHAPDNVHPGLDM